MLEIIAVRLWQPAPVPRHLLQTLTRLGHNEDRCKWYYTHYGRSSGSYEGGSSAAATAAAGTSGGAGGAGEDEFLVAERKTEWDKVYVQQTRGGLRAGFQQVIFVDCRKCQCCAVHPRRLFCSGAVLPHMSGFAKVQPRIHARTRYSSAGFLYCRMCQVDASHLFFFGVE